MMSSAREFSPSSFPLSASLAFLILLDDFRSSSSRMLYQITSLYIANLVRDVARDAEAIIKQSAMPRLPRRVRICRRVKIEPPRVGERGSSIRSRIRAQPSKVSPKGMTSSAKSLGDIPRGGSSVRFKDAHLFDPSVAGAARPARLSPRPRPINQRAMIVYQLAIESLGSQFYTTGDATETGAADLPSRSHRFLATSSAPWNMRFITGPVAPFSAQSVRFANLPEDFGFTSPSSI